MNLRRHAPLALAMIVALSAAYVQTSAQTTSRKPLSVDDYTKWKSINDPATPGTTAPAQPAAAPASATPQGRGAADAAERGRAVLDEGCDARAHERPVAGAKTPSGFLNATD